MGAQNMERYLRQVAAFLKTPAGKITAENSQLPMSVIGNKTVVGFFNIIQQYLQGSALGGSNSLQETEIRQWIEYGLIYVMRAEENNEINQVLRELNSFLSIRTYLVNHRLTIADIVLYYMLLRIMETLQIVDKEKYINVSRWFDNLQVNSSVRQSNNTVNFNTTYLSSFVPVRH